eukprot:356296-Chlamydomonas_euryale.AAC.2
MIASGLKPTIAVASSLPEPTQTRERLCNIAVAGQAPDHVPALFVQLYPPFTLRANSHTGFRSQSFRLRLVSGQLFNSGLWAAWAAGALGRLSVSLLTKQAHPGSKAHGVISGN